MRKACVLYKSGLIFFRLNALLLHTVAIANEDQCYRVKEIGISSSGSHCVCYEYKFYYDYIYTDVCINLTSFVESCWTGNLRILHSPLTMGEWTGTQASEKRS